jgi:hypothetical protein
MKRRFVKCGVIAVAAIMALWSGFMHVAAQGPGVLVDPNLKGKPVATPRTADGHPDLSGFWAATGGGGPIDPDAEGNFTFQANARGASPVNSERDATLMRRADPNRPIYKAELWDKVQNLDYNRNEMDSYFSCKPPGVPRMGPPARIVQTAKDLILLYQGLYVSVNTFRVIPTDGRPHDPIASEDQTWLGDSVGHWEGDTLVVDVVGFNDVSWLDYPGYFHTADMRVTERFRRDGDTLNYQVTVEDPDVLVKPWVRTPRTLTLNTDPHAILTEELPCSERDLGHLVTKEHH